MKRTSNKYQENYIIAKAQLEALEEQSNQIERDYIKAHGITNPDGAIPELVYCIEDMDVFDQANEATAKIVEDSGLWAEILSARDILEAAEETLIAYGLSIAPTKIAATLRESAKTNYTTRLKLIDLVMKLDVSTVSA